MLKHYADMISRPSIILSNSNLTWNCQAFSRLNRNFNESIIGYFSIPAEVNSHFILQIVLVEAEGINGFKAMTRGTYGTQHSS